MWKLEASPCEHSRAASARTTARHDTRREQAPFRLPRSSGISSSAESDSVLPGTPLLRNWCHHRGGGDTLRIVSGGIEEAAGARPALTTDAAGLLSRASTGDTSALADLFDRFGGLFSACISTVQADPGARDRLCTEVFTAVWRRAREGSRVPEPVLWLLEVLCETLGSTVDSARRPIAREVLALGCPIGNCFCWPRPVAFRSPRSPRSPESANLACARSSATLSSHCAVVSGSPDHWGIGSPRAKLSRTHSTFDPRRRPSCRPVECPSRTKSPPSSSTAST